MILLVHSNRTLCSERGPVCFFPPNASALLTQTTFCTSANEAFRLFWNPCLQTGLQGVVARVTWSTTVIRVIWSAVDVKVNIFPSLCSGKFMFQRQQQDGGFHIYCSLLSDITKAVTTIPMRYTDSPVSCTGPQLKRPTKKSHSPQLPVDISDEWKVSFSFIYLSFWGKTRKKTNPIFIANYFIT